MPIASRNDSNKTSEITVCVPSLAQHMPKPFQRAKGPSLRSKVPSREKADAEDWTFMMRTLITSTGFEAAEQTKPCERDAVWEISQAS